MHWHLNVNLARKIRYCGMAISILQGVPKKSQTIENNPLLEFQWPSTKLSTSA